MKPIITTATKLFRARFSAYEVIADRYEKSYGVDDWPESAEAFMELADEARQDIADIVTAFVKAANDTYGLETDEKAINAHVAEVFSEALYDLKERVRDYRENEEGQGRAA